ncbi:MAG TPA: hydantoinase B/oxoprolinase family protein, partial [Bradyrhizobium sp.]|nr:hydantoinase B/oxoprolinase family protein [Bradyrhizobium sp.]
MAMGHKLQQRRHRKIRRAHEDQSERHGHNSVCSLPPCGGALGRGVAPGPAHTIDPITLEVIRHGLVSITNQIDANIKRTAFSPYIYEYNDFAVGLVGTEGQL